MMKEDKEIKASELKLKIINVVLSHGGLCTTKFQLDKLYSSLKNGLISFTFNVYVT